MSLPTFSSNYTADGKLFKRKHGYSVDLTANELKLIEIPIIYNKCKLTKLKL